MQGPLGTIASATTAVESPTLARHCPLTAIKKLKRILDETLKGRLSLHLKRKFGDRQAAFEALYRLRYWNIVGPTESVSGPGSAIGATVTIREALASLMKELNVKSVFDAACGDFNWMKEVDLGEATYEGVDIVPAIVETVRQKYGGPLRRFRVLDIVEGPIPRVDLILCRDVLIHLPDREALKVLENISASGSKYLL